MEIHKITLELEELAPPEGPLNTLKPEDIINKYSHAFCSSLKNDLAMTGDHPVLDGFVRAYTEHRPITISPDILWLLIVQGFSYHVEYNSEQLRSKFVNFQNKKTLEFFAEYFDVSDQLKWENIFRSFASKISEYSGEELMNSLTPNFSTTTPTSYTAGLISIMASMKNYFIFQCTRRGCGIPSVTIEGTVKDWELIKDKLQIIQKYDLEWWVSKLEPIIDEIIQTKKGNVNKKFWLQMIRYKNIRGIYKRTCIDGWICTFYPYNKYGNKNQLNQIFDQNNLPREVLTVPMKLTTIYPGKQVEYLCNIHTGFFGLTQDSKTLNLKPEIGWLICQVLENEETPDKSPTHILISKQYLIDHGTLV
ncbi:hypothetical protein TRFO_25552 [Tritrichomonas foetus]|uniref:Uncharacterized protein n=1 Tax=Tritrichomonas foetus TaxID=1144522 RepID=A0A1J4K9X3_9EUKA|nr:hypothetical protein TRFO_25552 [Tritrichomonas foetus]|eukprot:OHT06438.1 hypothetical protein TRFO_25552 [Tritrichomonas foetus]